MTQPVIQVGNVGTVFVFTVIDQDNQIVNLSTATVLEAYFRRPDRTTFLRTGSLTTDGTDGKFQYATIAGDLDVAGDCWKRQGHVSIPSLGEFKTEVKEFSVKGNLI